ncbi:MAG: glycoside hydrolase family 3 N-terminal domain-containing protein [Ferruginibacter sp.]
MRKLIAAIGCLSVLSASAQNKAAQQWADSVFKSLTPEQRIAQLMVVRLSTYDRKTGQVTYFDKKVSDLVKQYNIGSVCVFQGAPVMQAKTFNALQAAAKTPLLMCIDAEWGLGMRLLDSVMPLPKQMMLGAMQDSSIVYEYGKLVAGQCKRFGIQVNYAPVVDVNNNPSNPVINERSFGEDKYKVSRFGIQYMKGLQDNGVMACAKHFPGHGDVAVDSHLDLPVINKSLQQLDSLELYPFRQLFKAGVASAMIAHLYIPAIDTAANRATSLSKNNVTGLLRNQLGFQGLTFTDALGMKGVAKFFPDGEIAVQALIAGNDMLCLPDDIPLTLAKIKKAIAQKKLSRADLDQRCKKVLLAKYYYGLANLQPVDTMNLVADLNKGVAAMRRKVAENALTVLAKDNPAFFPFPAPLQPVGGTVALVSVGTNADNAFAKRLRSDYQADVFYFDYKQDSSTVNKLADSLKKTYKQVIIGVHAYSSYPANNFGISKAAVDLVSRLQQLNNSVSFVFGNPYAIKNWCGARNLVACYEDDEIVQQTAADLLEGKINPKGTLPVTVCDQYHYGSGIAGSGFFLSRPRQPLWASTVPGYPSLIP